MTMRKIANAAEATLMVGGTALVLAMGGALAVTMWRSALGL